MHKLLFSFAMTTKIQEVESELNREELHFFIKVSFCCKQCNYRIAGKFGGELNLVVWQSILQLPN